MKLCEPNRWWEWLVSLALLNIIDVLLTVEILRLGGAELNQGVSLFAQYFGWTGVLCVKLLGVALLGVLGRIYRCHISAGRFLQFFIPLSIFINGAMLCVVSVTLGSILYILVFFTQ